MMKSFFKKLAFVMALAMVVSMVAPAAQKAVAAEDKKPLAIAYQKGAVITALNLVEVGDTEDLRFVYAPANWKDLEVKWESSNEDVVTVDESGVVEAKAEGTATVTVTVGDETASVEVYSVETATFVATMGNAEDRAMTELTLTVGEEFDFAFYGIKDYSMDIYRCDWFAVDPDGVLDFDDSNGKLVAKKAGSAKISLGVMNLKTGIKTDVAPCTVTVKDVEPEVDPNNFEVTKMLSDSSFELTFENKKITQAELEKGLSVYYYVGNQRIQYNYPRTVEVKDGVATVKFYSLVTNGTTYGFKYADIEKETTVKIGEPTSMYLTWKDLGGTNHTNVAYAGYNTLLEAHILNAEGAEITNSVLNESQGRYVEFYLADTSVAAQYYMQGNNQIYFTAADQTALVVGRLWYGFDNLGQRVESVSSVPTAITSTTRPIRTFAFQEVGTASVTGSVWDNVRKFAVGDEGKAFKVRLKDNYGTTVEVKNGAMTYDSEVGLGVHNSGLGSAVVNSRFYGQFTFASDNIGIFTIDPNSGYMVANRAGQANVLVYYDPDMYNTTSADKVLVAVVPITTYDRRVATSFSIDSNLKTVSTKAGDGGYNVTTFTLTIKDQLGDKINVNMNDLAAYTKSVETAYASNPVLSDISKVAGTTGEYRVTITCNDGNVEYVGGSRAVYYGFSYKNAERVTFTANVIRPNTDLQASSYAFDAGTCHWWHNDINPFKQDNPADHTLTAGLYVYKNGVKVAKENVTLMTWDNWNKPYTASFDKVYVKVLKNGADVTEKVIGNGTATEAGLVATGNEVKVSLAKRGVRTEDGYNVVDYTLGAGTYTILAYKAVKTSANPDVASPQAMQLIASSTVEVKDTKMAVTYAGKLTDGTGIYGGTLDTPATGYDNVQANLDQIAYNSFAIKVGDHTCRADWNSWKNVKVHANAVQYNANTTYFESLEVYVPVGGVEGNPADGYVRYVVPVGDYVITR